MDYLADLKCHAVWYAKVLKVKKGINKLEKASISLNTVLEILKGCLIWKHCSVYHIARTLEKA